MKKALVETDPHRKIQGLLDYLERLREIILSPETFEVKEDIYHKRHIAADIPSVYGSYHEAKFDALGLTLRLETLVNALLEDLVTSSDMGLVTWATMARTHTDLRLIQRALRLDGISSPDLEIHLDLLDRALRSAGSPSASSWTCSVASRRPSGPWCTMPLRTFISITWLPSLEARARGPSSQVPPARGGR